MSSLDQSAKIVYLVRHGQSVDNVSPVFQSVHSPLSDKSILQAKQLAGRIVTIEFDALIASSLPRAKQTAEVIARESKKTLELSDLFVERIKPAIVDGKPWDDPEASKAYGEWHESLYTPGHRVLDGENYDDIIERVDNALVFLLHRPEKRLVVVTHGYFLRTILSRVLLGEALTGDMLKRIQMLAAMENTGITVLHHKDAYEEKACWRLWTHNDHAHFAE